MDAYNNGDDEEDLRIVANGPRWAAYCETVILSRKRSPDYGR